MFHIASDEHVVKFHSGEVTSIVCVRCQWPAGESWHSFYEKGVASIGHRTPDNAREQQSGKNQRNRLQPS